MQGTPPCTKKFARPSGASHQMPKNSVLRVLILGFEFEVEGLCLKFRGVLGFRGLEKKQASFTCKQAHVYLRNVQRVPVESTATNATPTCGQEVHPRP